MSEEFKQEEINQAQDSSPGEAQKPAETAEETGLPEVQDPLTISVAVPTAVTMWNDPKRMNLAFRTARILSCSAMVPDVYRNSPENCLVAIDIANRLGISPLMVMQNLYVVKGKPSWSGSFCAAAINGSGRFTPLEYEFVGDAGTPSYGCYATAVRVSTGKRCSSETITMKMAQDEGWLGKQGSKWRTMPQQMMMYRAAAFFARVFCPDILLGIPTYEEVQGGAGIVGDGDVYDAGAGIARASFTISGHCQIGQSITGSYAVPRRAGSRGDNNGDIFFQHVIASRGSNFAQFVSTLIQAGDLKQAIVTRGQDRIIRPRFCGNLAIISRSGQVLPAVKLAVGDICHLVSIRIQQDEFRALQLRVVVLAVHLGGIQLVGKDDDLILGGVAGVVGITGAALIGLVGVFQLNGVCVAVQTDLCVCVQYGTVFHNDISGTGNTTDSLQISTRSAMGREPQETTL